MLWPKAEHETESENILDKTSVSHNPLIERSAKQWKPNSRYDKYIKAFG